MCTATVTAISIRSRSQRYATTWLFDVLRRGAPPTLDRGGAVHLAWGDTRGSFLFDEALQDHVAHGLVDVGHDATHVSAVGRQGATDDMASHVRHASSAC
jgi:hypothetical protein